MLRKDAVRQLLEAFQYDKSSAIKAIRDFAGSTTPKVTPNAKNAPIAIALRSVSKNYKLKGQELQVLRGITLDIHEGEFVVITGSSGSGKSTLLQLMGALDKPSAGTIEIYQQDVGKLSDGKLSRLRSSTIGFVFQFFYLQPFLRLEKNIEVPGMFARSKRDDRIRRVEELLSIVGLEDQRMHYPRQLSGGQMQRAAISRALLNNPKIILADEPTGNLDSKNSEVIIGLFLTLQKRYNMTVVMVTHDEEIASRADRVLVMKDGQVQ